MDSTYPTCSAPSEWSLVWERPEEKDCVCLTAGSCLRRKFWDWSVTEKAWWRWESLESEQECGSVEVESDWEESHRSNLGSMVWSQRGTWLWKDLGIKSCASPAWFPDLTCGRRGRVVGIENCDMAGWSWEGGRTGYWDLDWSDWIHGWWWRSLSELRR